MGADPDCPTDMSVKIDEDIFLESDGLQIAARVFRPATDKPAPAILVCHGFGSRKERHAEFAQTAAQAGFVVLGIDFRGHGASDGCLDSRTINDLGCALEWLEKDEQVDAGRIAVRGSSMGGYFAIHAAARWDKVAAVVAVCPTTEEGMSQLLRDARDPNTETGRWRASGVDFPRVMRCDLTCWLEVADVNQAIADITPRPLLIIHSMGDEVIPIASSEALFEHAGEPKAFWRIPGGDHRSAQHDPEINKRTIEWLNESF